MYTPHPRCRLRLSDENIAPYDGTLLVVAFDDEGPMTGVCLMSCLMNRLLCYELFIDRVAYRMFFRGGVVTIINAAFREVWWHDPSEFFCILRCLRRILTQSERLYQSFTRALFSRHSLVHVSA